MGRLMGVLIGLVFAVGWMGCGQSRPNPPAIGIHQAVLKDDLKSVQQHIAAGTDLNTKDKNGWTPLHLAALRGNLAIAQALVAGGADLNRPGMGGRTPAALAREQGKITVANYLEEQAQAPAPGGGGRRGLVDGGLGVSEVLDSQ